MPNNYLPVCPHNDGVDCATPNCESCGWHPPVAAKRQAAVAKLNLYRVPFTGYCEVWATSSEEAAEKAEDIKNQFFAHYDYGEAICLSKEEKNELD